MLPIRNGRAHEDENRFNETQDDVDVQEGAKPAGRSGCGLEGRKKMVRGEHVPRSPRSLREVLSAPRLSVLPPVEPSVFLQEFVVSFFESRLLSGFISVDEYHDTVVALRR